MYVLTDGEVIAGMAAVALCQGDEYLNVSWEKDLPNDEVETVHLLAVCPDYRGKSLGLRILDEAMEIAVRKGKKALRLDALKSNLPAQKMYEKAGFTYIGEQRLYAENAGFVIAAHESVHVELGKEHILLFLHKHILDDGLFYPHEPGHDRVHHEVDALMLDIVEGRPSRCTCTDAAEGLPPSPPEASHRHTPWRSAWRTSHPPAPR